MYKTIRHGENSLQYTILPQQENGIDGKQLITRRRHKCDLITYVIIFVITLMIGGALTISLRILFHNPRWLANGNRVTLHMKERLYEAFYGKNYAETQQLLNQQQHHTLNDSKIGNFNTQSSTNNWSNGDISSGSEAKKPQIPTESFSIPSTPSILVTSSTTTTTTTTTASPPVMNFRSAATNTPPVWKSVIKTEEYAYDPQDIQNKILQYTSNPISHEFDDLYSIRRNYNDAGLVIQQNDSHNSQAAKTTRLEESSSSSVSMATTTSTPPPPPPITMKDSLVSIAGTTNIVYVNDAQKKLNFENGGNAKPWIKSYWPFVDSSTYFQWTVSVTHRAIF